MTQLLPDGAVIPEGPIAPGLSLSPQERKKRNQQLEQKAEKMLQKRGAPDFGANESEVLKIKNEHETLKVSNNQLIEAVKKIQAQLSEVNSSIKKIQFTQLGCAEYFSGLYPDFKKMIDLHAETKEFESMGYHEKPGDTVEDKDLILMKFKLFDGDKLIDDKTDTLLAYTVGTGDLSCDAEILGMKRGEQKLMDVVFKKFPQPEYVGKQLKMDLTVANIKVKLQK